MSYNTRRNTTGFSSTPPQQNAAAVGQRRPVVTNNFVSGGQLAGNQQQQKPAQIQQQPRAPQQQQQQQAGINFRNQTPTQGQQTYQTQSYSTQQPPAAAPAAQPTPQARYQQAPPQQAKVEPRPPQPTPVIPVVPQAVPIVPGANPPPPESSNGDNMETNTDGTKKKLWFKNRGKISKAEKVRRRNLRLSKILQPKNAVMILNELVKGCTYNCDDLPCKVDTNSFRASVTFEGQEFAGIGRTKIAAKNAAAETALKYLIKNKQLKVKKDEDSDGDEKMEIGEEDGTHVMPWSHIASFAMYKLFSTWGEDPSTSNKVQEIMGTVPKAVPVAPGVRPELKPAKKMPDNPEKMNPLMLMNQMLPGAQWAEVGKSGSIPNVVFTYSVTVDDKTFTGTGTNKKAARKLAAFAACQEILKIDYPADVWVPIY